MYVQGKNFLKKALTAVLLLAASLQANADANEFKSYAISKEKHTVQLLDTGASALYKMLAVINSAEKSIDVNNFLINFNDFSAMLLFEAIEKRTELMRKTNPDFKARIILEDSNSTGGGYSDFQFWQWRSVLQKYNNRGIEFRLFNPAQGDPSKANVRNHQKYIIADGREFVLGGRNWSDDYYGIVPIYNRLDKEIYVKSEATDSIAQVAHNNFMILWESKFVENIFKNSDEEEKQKDYYAGIERETPFNQRTVESKGLKLIDSRLQRGFDGLALDRLAWIKGGATNVVVLYTQNTIEKLKNSDYVYSDPYSKAKTHVSYADFVAMIEDSEKLLKERNIILRSKDYFLSKLEQAYRDYSKESHRPPIEVTDIALGFDMPGRIRKQDSFIPTFYKTIAAAEKKVLFENQYFIPSEAGWKLLNQLKTKKVDIYFLTNSLVSQDENNPGTLTHDKMRSYLGVNSNHFFPYAFRGRNLENIPGAFWWDGIEGNPKCNWQIHGKAVVIDDKAAWVGSNNFDNRSQEFNPEDGVYVVNSQFALQVTDSIQNNIRNADDMSLSGDYWKRYDQKMKQRPLLKKVVDVPMSGVRNTFHSFW